MVWQHGDGNDLEIYLWDGGTPTQITDNDTNDQTPDISGSNVVWQGRDYDYEIYLWSGGITTNVSNNSASDQLPAISGSNVVWLNYTTRDIHFWNGVASANISNNSAEDGHPAISGSKVVWMSRDGSPDYDYEIYMTTVPELVPALPIAGLFVMTGLLGLAGWRMLRA